MGSATQEYNRGLLVIFAAPLIAVILTAGCARWQDRIAGKGGIVTSHRAVYVVISESGGVIMDVYKLPDAIVQSESGSDGWLFLDHANHAVYVGGDVKHIRMESTNDSLWAKYIEYHFEFEGGRSYHEVLATSVRGGPANTYRWDSATGKMIPVDE